MYLPHLTLGYAVAILLVLIGCRVSARGVPGLAGMNNLSWGLAASFVGMMALALHTVAPLWVTSVLAIEAILSYSVLFYAALAQILEVRSRIVQWGTALLILAAVGNLYFTYEYPSISARILVACLIRSVGSLAAALLIFRYRRSSVQTGAHSAGRHYVVGALGWLQIVIAVVDGMRSLLTVLYPPTDSLHLDHIQVTSTYLNLILSLGSGAGLIWLAFYIHREDLYARANTDGLTGLLNRRAFDELLVRELDNAHADLRSVVVLMADIDFFKRVNDTWGHQAGDEVLRQVASALRRGLRPSDALARFGGEEFAIVLREGSLAQAGEVAERLRAGVAVLSRLPGDVRITISLGLAASVLGEKPEQLIERCDQALYRSKREGRNRVSIAADMTTGEMDPNSAPASPLPRLGETQRSA